MDVFVLQSVNYNEIKNLKLYYSDIKTVIINFIYKEIKKEVKNLEEKITKIKKIDLNKIYFYDTYINLKNINNYTDEELEKRCLLFNNEKLRIIKSTNVIRIDKNKILDEINKMNNIKPLKKKINPTWIFNKYYEQIKKYKRYSFLNTDVMNLLDLDKNKIYTNLNISKQLFDIFLSGYSNMLKENIQNIYKIFGHNLYCTNYWLKYCSGYYLYRGDNYIINNTDTEIKLINLLKKDLYNTKDYCLKIKKDFYIKFDIDYCIKYNFKYNKIYLLSDILKKVDSKKLRKNYFIHWFPSFVKLDLINEKYVIIKKIIKIQKFYKKYFK